ncbi:hypothetical protein [Actinomadura sp. NBRC 104425]|uniref:hypothetical protein n=1 Tax=Actinomadura sp. NBRC 104425 TaxID=3032204 RepID=UPI0025533838|nr:hypothetical protein [Actinomadura sp. NBRC 104425]
MTTRIRRIAIMGVAAPVVALGAPTMALAAPVSATHHSAGVQVSDPHDGYRHHRFNHHRHFFDHHRHFFKHHRHFIHHRHHVRFGHGGFGHGYSGVLLTKSATIAGTGGAFTVSSAAR